MSLATGSYTVRSLKDKSIVGRFIEEERSIRPKPIFALPADFPQADNLEFEKQDDGFYRITARGAAVTHRRDLLFADIIDIEDEGSNHKLWRVMRQFRRGENVHTIHLANEQEKGWTVPAPISDWPFGPQVAVKSLTTGPNYDEAELFIISPA
ncbi:hypothetical protein D9611_010537 [Ephemerocybe angulata]|uniref:Uncharacterized protein n=1 Tax=Ephemerocybe angulata TaxID=980116 RepID=A0A8H5BX82_9AGAR|nr:hypothetical protein D9611_010537 [Tulosesus angulatus]